MLVGSISSNTITALPFSLRGLQAAEEANPNGTRTIAVVTKIHLVDAGAEMAVHELLLNKKKKMRLGYHALKCRS